ncbi:MAG TPA: HEXXH motif-containing putative peptide modification protein [Bacillota bacterium]|nr:HEXXH motif-containing putative peptide modification protein [Bacillota bacterium]
METYKIAKSIDFPFLNYNHLQNNLVSVIEYIKGEGYCKNSGEMEIKKQFIEVLNSLQNSNLSFNREIIIEFNNQEHTQKMIENGLLSNENTLNNKHLFPESEQSEIIYKIRTALSLLKTLHNDLYNLINQYISTIYVVKNEGFGGGSVSGYLGFIWLNIQPQWSVIDIAENIYHEFIHNALFIDDMVNCLFPDPLACAEPDGLVTSTILESKRPLDKSYHAANVAVGIMHFYFMLRLNREDKNYLSNFSSTVDEINTKTHLLGNQGKNILQVMNAFKYNPDFNSITETLTKD